jgi:hypothetical protein
VERTILPRPHLQLAGAQRLVHIDTCFGEPPEMFFPSLRVNEMVGSVPSLETILDERAKHAMLLVDAVEERTNMTILAESAPGKLRGLCGGVHILAFTQKEPCSGPADRFGAARFDPARGSGATGRCDERGTAYVLAPPLSTDDGARDLYDGHRHPVSLNRSNAHQSLSIEGP